MKLKPLPRVAIVGRANVGKSTLWNKLTETSRALVSIIPNTTRDRNYAPCFWRGKTIELVDTGGMDSGTANDIEIGIRKQAEFAIHEADVVLFMVDIKAGVIGQDKELAASVRKINPHIILVANKSDRGDNLGQDILKELWHLGLGEPVFVSSANGRGLGDLLDLIYNKLDKLKVKPAEIQADKELNIVIMGRPNVGKSSLTNAILGEERSIVSPIPHTTREPLDTHLIWKGHLITLVDTAGIRKRARISERLELDALNRNRAALSRADVAVLVIDATDDPRKQDKRLAGLLKDARKGLIIVVNKWDLIKNKTTSTANSFIQSVHDALPFLTWAPIIFTSAIKGQRVKEILNTALEIQDEQKRLIQENALDKLIKHLIAKQSPRAVSGTKAPYIKSVVQIATEPPTFLMTTLGKTAVHSAWLRFFENQLRKKFGFSGTPIIIKIEQDSSPQPTNKGPHKRKRTIGRKGFRY